MVLQDLCEARGLPFVCVQPLVSHIAREQEDLTGDKTDEGDSGLIARLARELHCYVPERLEGAWAELRDEGRRRAQLITNATAAKQLIRDKLGLVRRRCWSRRASRSAPRPGWRRWRWCWSSGGDAAAVTAMGYEAFAARGGRRAARLGRQAGRRDLPAAVHGAG